MDIRELYWAAGFLEGEGSFGLASGSICVRTCQKASEPLERLQKLFGGNIYMRTRHNQYYWQLYSVRAAGICMTLYMLMSRKRKHEIKRSLNIWLKSRLSRELVKKGYII